MNYGGIGNIRGIQKASQQYFDKNVWELNLSECALLAGIVNSPYYYDPHNYLDHATARRNEVIDMLEHHGYITEADGDLARAVKVEDLLVDPMHMFNNGGSYRYQAYIDEAIKEAERITGQDPLNVSMEIYTCMDPDIQELMEDIQAGDTEIQFFDDKVEIAMISENNQTGEIVGIGGGRNYARGGSMLLNHATDQFNQPGSTVKPFLDYALAMEYLGWATSHTVTDKPVSMGAWTFTNAGTTSYRGQMDLRQALGISLNTPAILCMMDVIDEIGEDKVKEYLQSLNFSHVNIDYFDIQYAIGASSFSASCEELMAAHAIFMNGGHYIEPHTISKIVYRSGLQEPLEPTYINRQVLSEQVAYMMSTLLQSNADIDWGNLMNVCRKWYPVYAKTGTTDWGDAGVEYGIPIGEGKDEWMVVQTSNYSSCVWIGYEKPEPYENTYLSMDKILWNIPGYINSMLLDALNPDGAEGVARPEGVSDITHIVGLFPYTAPVEGMPSEYIRTGLVKSEFATLKAPQSADPLEALSSFSATIDNNFTGSFSWASYPDESKLSVESSGKLFDWPMLWGPVVYKARIMQNGTTIREITSSGSSTTVDLSDLAENTSTEVCGFYSYENMGGSSNEVCSAFTTPAKRAIAPGQGASLGDFQAFASRFGFELEVTEIPASGDKPAGTVDLILDGHNVCGQEIPRSTKKLYANVYVDKSND
jgi:penicillin-binding protein 1A